MMHTRWFVLSAGALLLAGPSSPAQGADDGLQLASYRLTVGAGAAPSAASAGGRLGIEAETWVRERLAFGGRYTAGYDRLEWGGRHVSTFAFGVHTKLLEQDKTHFTLSLTGGASHFGVGRYTASDPDLQASARPTDDIPGSQNSLGECTGPAAGCSGLAVSPTMRSNVGLTAGWVKEGESGWETNIFLRAEANGILESYTVTLNYGLGKTIVGKARSAMPGNQELRMRGATVR